MDKQLNVDAMEAALLARPSIHPEDTDFAAISWEQLADPGADARRHAARLSRYFYDTEFHWDGHGIQLVSIAVITDTGRELYEHSEQYDLDLAASDSFLAQHVLPAVAQMPRRSDAELRQRLDAFFEPRPAQLWADFGAWDQIALMQIWGAMCDQPEWLPMATRDVRQFAGVLGHPLPAYPDSGRNALCAAKHVRSMFRLIECRLDRTVRMNRQG